MNSCKGNGTAVFRLFLLSWNGPNYSELKADPHRSLLMILLLINYREKTGRRRCWLQPIIIERAPKTRCIIIITWSSPGQKTRRQRYWLQPIIIEKAPKTRCIIIISFRFISSTNCPTTALSVVGRRHLAKSMQEVSTTCVLSLGQGPPLISCPMYSPHRQNRYMHRNHVSCWSRASVGLGPVSVSGQCQCRSRASVCVGLVSVSVSGRCRCWVGVDVGLVLVSGQCMCRASVCVGPVSVSGQCRCLCRASVVSVLFRCQVCGFPA